MCIFYYIFKGCTRTLLDLPLASCVSSLSPINIQLRTRLTLVTDNYNDLFIQSLVNLNNLS